jgi:hypothetical protein
MMGRIEFSIGEKSFHDVLMGVNDNQTLVLTIVKCSFNSNVVYICVGDGCHLRFLDGRNATFWM